MTSSYLDRLPDEILIQVLQYLPPHDNLYSVPAALPRLARVANENRLWRSYCRSSFRYWHPRHRLSDRLRAPARDTNWKQLFLLRVTTNDRIALLFEHNLRTYRYPHGHTEELAKFGYDAKDYLLQQSRASGTLDDGLARRYYAKSLLSSIHKSIAIETWLACRTIPWPASSSSHPHPPTIDHAKIPSLEAALGAFEMFVCANPSVDNDDISCILDRIAARFLASHSTFDKLSTRQQALALSTWLRRERLTGMSVTNRSAFKLRNYFFGQALFGDDQGNHDSMPLISCAIFCAVAGRLGLESQSSSFPHALAVIAAKPGRSLDGGPFLESGDAAAEFINLIPDQFRGRDRMYVDPFNNGREVYMDEIRQRIAGFAPNQEKLYHLVTADTVPHLLARTADQLRQGLFDLNNTSIPGFNNETTKWDLVAGNTAFNEDAARYAADWVFTLLQAHDFTDARLTCLTGHVFYNAPEDMWLVEKYLAPLQIHLWSHGKPQIERWRNVVWPDRDCLRLRQCKSKVDTASDLAIGHVVRFKRYDYIGIISVPDGQWQATSLLTRRSSSTGDTKTDLYYHVISVMPSYSHGTVAKAGLERIYDPSLIPASLFEIAGRYFKRFDAVSCTFVSNLTEDSAHVDG